MVIPTSLLGFRKWRIEGDKLVSSVRPSEWKPGINTAVCDKHSAPGASCLCGFNGFYMFKESYTSSYKGVIGAFTGSGDVQLHDDGFRSERAEVIALYSNPLNGIKYKAVARSYGVPLFYSKKKFLEYTLGYPNITVGHPEIDYTPDPPEALEARAENFLLNHIVEIGILLLLFLIVLASALA